MNEIMKLKFNIQSLIIIHFIKPFKHSYKFNKFKILEIYIFFKRLRFNALVKFFQMRLIINLYIVI